MGHIDGSTFAPPLTIALTTETNSSTTSITPNPEYHVWRKIDHFVRACVNATLTEPLSSHILGLKTRKEVWDAFAKLFQQQSIVRKTYLYSELQTIQKGSSSITDYVHRIKTLADSLATIDERVKDFDLVGHTLNGLGSEYGAFIITIENNTPPVSFTELRAKLLTHEQRLRRGYGTQSTAFSDPHS